MSDDEPTSDETWEPRPVPDITPETAPYWDGAAAGELRLGHCPECDLTFFYPRAHCPDCLAKAETRQADGTGTVYSYSVPSKMPGWPEENLPLIVAYVELDEGPRVLTNIVDCDPDDLAIGDRVSVAFVPAEKTESDVAIPVFRLTSSE